MAKKKNLIKNKLSGQTILDAMPEIAYVFNKEQQMLMWNKNTERILGYTAEELYLKDAFDFVEEITIKQNTEAFDNIFSNQVEQIIEQNLITKSGEKIPVLDTANYALVDGKEYLIGLSIDIRKLRHTEDKLRNVINELQKLKEQLEAENLFLKEEREDHFSLEDSIVGESELIVESMYHLSQVAPTETPVLLKGETGTHKEKFARIIHNKSKRKDHAFIKIDCSSSSSTQIESKLFGHEKGAFPSALHQRIGKIEIAHQGTLFLYEIGELTMDLQAKLFKVLSEKTFERMGSSKLIKSDIRIIASTKYKIEDLIKKGLFREDLYYRINIYPIIFAPLRDRIVDIHLFAEHYVQVYNKKLGKNISRIRKNTIKEMQRYSWPGNILELENLIERAVIISKGSLLMVESLDESLSKEEDLNLLPLAEYEKKYIIKVLEKTFWRVDGPKGAAQILEMHPETLRSRMRKLNIERP